jgi:hypothetical protein
MSHIEMLPRERWRKNHVIKRSLILIVNENGILTLHEIRRFPINRPLLKAIEKMSKLKYMRVFDCVVFDGNLPIHMLNAWRMGKNVFVLYLVVTPPWDYFSYGRVVFTKKEK